MIKILEKEFKGNYNIIEGIKLFEQAPQQRIVYIAGIPYKIKLPYLYFILKYNISKNKYNYAGQPGLAFWVFAKKSKINSLLDKVGLLPYETVMQGLICTNHNYDNKKFDSLEELEKFVFNEFYSINNLMLYYDVVPQQKSMIRNESTQAKIKKWNETDLDKLNFRENYSLCNKIINLIGIKKFKRMISQYQFKKLIYLGWENNNKEKITSEAFTLYYKKVLNDIRSRKKLHL